MDPSHHKEALTKFYTGNRQKPLSQLSWFYEASGAQTQSETLGEEPEDDNSDNDGHSTQSEFTIFPEVTETIDFKEEPANKQGWEEVVCGTSKASQRLRIFVSLLFQCSIFVSQSFKSTRSICGR